MSDLPAATADKLQSVKVAGWGYIVVGIAFLALRMYNTSRLFGSLAESRTLINSDRTVSLLVWIVLSTMVSIALGGLLIGGGIYLRRRLENARITLIVTSSALIVFSLIRTLQSAMVLVMLTHFSSTGGFGVELRRQGVSTGLSLLLALALGGLLVLITRPAVKNAMLPRQAAATTPPPPVAQATP
ncbi:MAG: hypothetical protein ACYC63_06410 [Armatimonadota bacterium]